MASNYVFLCGVMWCRFGQQDAGPRTTQICRLQRSRHEGLAWAMFAKGLRRLRELEQARSLAASA